MLKTVSAKIDESLYEFVVKLANGRYGNKAEVVRSALKLLQEQKTEEETLTPPT